MNLANARGDIKKSGRPFGRAVSGDRREGCPTFAVLVMHFCRAEPHAAPHNQLELRGTGATAKRRGARTRSG